MAKLPEASVDAIVTDPPYDLTAGKKGGSGPASATTRTPQGRARIGAGFMGKGWDATGVAFDPETWRRAYEALKPGGHLLAFGSPRTYHRMLVAVEDAGFEVRDCIMWVYGEGMPKSHDVAAAIDKLAGHGPRGRAIPVASHSQPDGTRLFANRVGPYEARTEAGQRWAGWGTALKPGYEPIVVARKPLTTSVARNVLAHGTGVLNIGACRVIASDAQLAEKYASVANAERRRNAVFGADCRERSEGRTTPHPAGRWPANLVLTHSPGCRQVGWQFASGYLLNRFTDGAKPFGGGDSHPYTSTQAPPQVAAVYDCEPGCPVADLDRQSGASASRAGRPRQGTPGAGWGMSHTGAEYDDGGGASRFFHTFAWDPELDVVAYCAKATTDEREAGLDERFPADEAGRRNHHPTVKPLALMRHLARLVTPPGGTVLDPFCGSGTTGMACVFEGFGFVGVEREPAYAEIAEARIAHAEELVARGYAVLPEWRRGRPDDEPGQMSLL
jgi:site-specific DNA-methyltransferase (adenine-specific)